MKPAAEVPPASFNRFNPHPRRVWNDAIIKVDKDQRALCDVLAPIGATERTHPYSLTISPAAPKWPKIQTEDQRRAALDQLVALVAEECGWEEPT